MTLPDLKEDFTSYLRSGSSSTAGDDLRELIKARLVMANASDRAVDTSVTFRPDNVTLAFSDRIRTFAWLAVRLLSASHATARTNLCLLHFLSPEREALSLIAEGDHQARTILMANSTNSTAQIEATKSSQLYTGGTLLNFRHVYEAFCNLRLLFSVMITDTNAPLVITKMAEYVGLLMDTAGKDLWEVYRNHPYLAVHPWQELQSILVAFLKPATNATLYASVIAGTGVQYENFLGAIATADSHIHDLRAILNGSDRVRGGGPDPTPQKRQKTADPGDNDRKKTLGMLTFDTAVAGTNRLPMVTARAKKRGGKTPERLCMKFLTRGYFCPGGLDCKMPHIINVDQLTADNRTKLVAFVKNQPGLGWVAGKAPAATSTSLCLPDRTLRKAPGPLSYTCPPAMPRVSPVTAGTPDALSQHLPPPGPHVVPNDDVDDSVIGEQLATRRAVEWYPTKSVVVKDVDVTLKEVFTQAVQRRFRHQLGVKNPLVLAKVDQPFDNEPPLTFAGAELGFMVWLYNLRVTYPREEIYIADDDVSGAFRLMKYHPNCMAMHTSIQAGYGVINTGGTFGDNTSPSNWDTIGQARRQLAWNLWLEDPTVEARVLPHIPPIQMAEVPTVVELEAFELADADGIN
ncbi:unknown protein [Seminavis robusta]|uniref:C3H1-type domain-containing protein n=1 Tax=Seminavis robusta TaxID=568900 RepID=A0A9N8EMJ4_9STRA|nr:unknown protein [Seminavis robusta]|eukprot:Sro1369_g266890.1 n/a (631) ;mRNA; r:4035-6863